MHIQTASAHPAHYQARMRQAHDVFSIILDGSFRSRKPTRDEVLQVASQLALTPRYWEPLAAQLEVSSLDHETKGLVMALLFQMADEAPALALVPPKAAPSAYPYRVKYYDPIASRRGRGVQVAAFATEDEARAFAVGKQLYGKPAVVEVMP